MTDGILRNLFAGFVRLHIIYHADKEPICGVEIMQELESHGYDLGPGTLYPMLRHLEQSGYLSCKEAVVAGKRRKNYRITARGRQLLVKARAKLKELVSEVVDDQDQRHPRH